MRAVVAILGTVSWFTTACGGGGSGTGDDADAAVSADAYIVGADVTTDSGPVHGVVDGDLVSFLGIPYAAPPTGTRRFAPPSDPMPWTAPLDASQFGPACPQNGAISANQQSEDCLSINVWAHAGAGPHPVIVWVHGGGYVAGSSREPLYVGATLARASDAVVVSFNYRLGVLGFLALPSLAATDGGNGNWGLRDQIAALAWVKRNIAAFGGDPSHVMIAGESAGGASICTLLAAPAAQGLYQAAAMESGTCRLVLEMTTTSGTFPSALSVGSGVASQLGCTTGDIASCMRAAAVPSVLAATVPFSLDLGVPIAATLPVVDGVVLDQRPMAAIRGGRGAVPLIAGSNREDTSYFVVNAMGVTNAAGAFDTYLTQLGITGSTRTTVQAMYPASLVTQVGAATALSTDIAFACPALALASVHPDTSRLYELQRQVPMGVVAGYGAVHGFDFIYLFGSFTQWGITPAAGDLALRDRFEQNWGAMARTGVPDPSWLVAGASGAYLALDLATTMATTSWRGGRCAQLATLGLLGAD